MTSGPVYQVAAGRGGLRASHADREQATEVLKTAFVQGRLTRDELEVRLGRAFSSRTYAELAAVIADIPAGLVRHRPVRDRPVGGRVSSPMSNAAKVAICVAIAAATLAVSFFTDTDVFVMFAFFYLMALVVAAVQILSERRDGRSRGLGGQKLPGRRKVAGSVPRQARFLSRTGRGSPPPACLRRPRAGTPLEH